MKKLLLGDEALAQAAIDAGLSGVYAYPGTPSTEITEYIQNSPIAVERGIHRRWSVNEKTAMEEALGMSFMGKRAMVCMKHVGLNVCADPFVNSAMTGTNGGLIVLVADDPSMHSSQNEQDSRFYAKFAMMPCLEPSSQQEAYDMVHFAFDYSERVHLPILMRITTRMAHSRAVVEVNDVQRKQNDINYDAKPSEWVLLPAMARRRNSIVAEQQKELEQDAVNSHFNKYIEGTDGLFEIRVQLGNNIFRIFCFFDGSKLVVLLSGFQKKTQKTPKGEIEKAVRLMSEYYIEKEKEAGK